MHVVKGGRIYQTFSLAKSNESGGKKSRIRHSKEERKEMVVSFIKKYQSLNNGSFPSLNLTHKEVGGSFYTVREIVRDIIQENRVLGPAKLLQGEHNNDEFLEQYPLGTISTQPHSSSPMSPSGSPFAAYQQESINDDLCLISDGHSIKAELEASENGKVTNGNRVLVKNTELVKKNVEGQVSELQETEQNIKGLTISKEKVTQIADVVVETFPLRPVIKQTNYLDGKSGELKGVNRTLEENDVNILHLGPGNDVSLPDGLTSSNNTFMVYEEVENLGSSCDLVDGKLAGQFVDSKLESLTLSTSLQDIKYEKEKHVLLEKNSVFVDKTGENLVEIRDPNLEGSNLSATGEGSVHEESTAAFLDGQSVENLAHPTFGSSNSASTKSGVVLDRQFDLDIEVVAENQVVSTPNGVEAKPLEYAHANGKSTTEDVMVDTDAGGQHAGPSDRGNNPTLSRIDLKSWQRSSKIPTGPKTQSLSAIFESFLTALMKFLSQ